MQEASLCHGIIMFTGFIFIQGTLTLAGEDVAAVRYLAAAVVGGSMAAAALGGGMAAAAVSGMAAVAAARGTEAVATLVLISTNGSLETTPRD